MKSERSNSWHPRHWPFYLGLSLLWLLAKLPLSSWSSICKVIGAVLQAIVPSRRRVVLRNLALAFPERDQIWHQSTCKKSYRALALSLLETSKLWFSEPSWLDDYVQFEGLHHLQTLQASGEAVILLSCHYTAIEVAGAALCRVAPFYPVYAAAKNEAFDQFQIDKRKRFAPDVVLRSDMRKAMRVLRDGGTLWLLPDQAVGRSHGAVPTLFFGQAVMSSTGPARLQRRSDAHMVVFELKRQGGKLLLTVQPPLEMGLDSDPAEQAQSLNHIFEQMIQRSPAEYFWHHKRFKSGQPGVNPYA